MKNILDPDLFDWTDPVCISLHGCLYRLETEYDHNEVRPVTYKSSPNLPTSLVRFENSELPITELDFPAVTICSQGLNMDNVAKAVERDFLDWNDQREKEGQPGRFKRGTEDGESLASLMSVYLLEKFDISAGDPGILDIIQSTSVGGGAAINVEAVTKNVKKCSRARQKSGQETKAEKEVSEPDVESLEQPVGNRCALMRDQALASNNFTVISNIARPQQCIDHCQKSSNCSGFTFTAGTCKVDHEMGKFVRQEGSISGRRCSPCVPLELSLVEGLTLAKESGVSLTRCQALCGRKAGCSHYNYYYSKIPADSWSRCVLVSAARSYNKPQIVNKDFVLSGQRCKIKAGQADFQPQQVEKVTREAGKSVVGSDLKSYSNISSVEICIDICHKTEGCEAYQYLGGAGTDDWKGNICHVKYKVRGLKVTEDSSNLISGYSYFVCNTTKLEQNQAVGQNLLAVKSADPSDCVERCLETEDCVGYSFSHKHRLCFIKSSLEYFQEKEGFTSGRACYRPPTYSQFDIQSVRAQVSQSPVMSLVLSSEPEMECEAETGSNNVTRAKRAVSLSEKIKLENPPNIDFLMNPTLEGKREEYKEYVSNKLKNFFKDRNSTKIYPNLFRLLWYTKTPCFDLFNMTGEHSHILKYCEWAGERLDCEHLFQAVPTDVGICCSFNFNSSLTETVYATLIRELKDKERLRRNVSLAGDQNVRKGKVGFEMGLKVVLDSHSNIASPATINSDGNAFQVYIGNPSEFPFLRNRAIQIQPGHENHVEVSGVKISADPAIHSHSLDKRKCKFYDESDLVFHTGYSYTRYYSLLQHEWSQKIYPGVFLV